MAVDLDIVEQELRRIPEVRAARIVCDDGGVPVEVHVLATLGKHAKQVVRDVQSVAIASQGLEIDHRIVSVVQLEEPLAPARDGATAAPAPPVRMALHVESVTMDRGELRCSASVRLRVGDQTVEAKAEGSVASIAARRVIADATLAALAQLDPSVASTSVESASLVRVGERDIAIAVLSVMVPPYEELVTGSALVGIAGPEEAVVRAVLDASGRRLAPLG